MPRLSRPSLLSASVLVAAGVGCGSTNHVADADGSFGGPAIVDEAGSGAPDVGNGGLPDDGGGALSGDAAVNEGGQAPIDSGDLTDIVACFGPPTSTAVAECGASCGNGVIDACPQCGPQPGVPGAGSSGAAMSGCTGVDPYHVKEQCDGTNLGGATCATIGFNGGTLGCAGSCDFDTSACVSCASGPSISACNTRILTDLGAEAAGPWSIAAAATDDEVLLAWTEAKPTNHGGSGADGDGVHLARFRASDLAVLWSSNCLFPGASQMTLARSATGYVIAYVATVTTATTSSTQPLAVQALDPSGLPIGAPLTTIPSAEDALLVPRQAPPSTSSQGSRTGAVSGGPLLLFWGPSTPNSDGLRATLLGNDGSEETSPVTISSAYLANNGVFTGDGFLVGAEAQLVSGGAYDAYVARIGLDGTVAGTTAPAGTGSGAGNHAWVAWSGLQARAVYVASAPTATDRSAVSANWIALDQKGVATGPGVLLPPMSSGTPTISAMAAGIGDDTAVVLLGENSNIGRPTRLDVMRVSGTGAILTAPVNVVADAEGIATVTLTTVGTDLIVAWIGGYASASPRLGIARITP